MLRLKIRPIERWPGEPTKERKRAPFRVGYSETMKLLEYELDKLDVRNVVLQMDCNERDIRVDGELRASAKPNSPAIILAFEYFVWGGTYNEKGQRLGRYLPLSFPCDTFDDWQDNLRAIALAMEALRKVDRYGVTRSGEQYKGWLALPESGGLQSDEDAARTLCRYAQTDTVTGVLKDADVAKAAYRAACRFTHSDTRADDVTDADFGKVQTAWQRIKMRHGL